MDVRPAVTLSPSFTPVDFGVHAVTLSDNPTVHGYPSIHNDHWDPLWEACADNGVVICCHIGTGVKAAHASDESPIDAWITSMPISISNSAADWIWAPMWKKYPKLRMALSEGGIGWIPYMLDRMDYEYEDKFKGHLSLKMKPSDYWYRQCRCTFQYDRIGARLLDGLGIENVMWGSDYPHPDGVFPDSQEYIKQQFSSLPSETLRKITCENVGKFYGLIAA